MQTYRLILNPSDVFYILWKRIEAVGEIVILESTDGQSIIACDPRNSNEMEVKFGNDYRIIWTRDELIGFFQANKLKFVVEKSNMTKKQEEIYTKYWIEIEYSDDFLTKKREIKTEVEVAKLIKSQQINAKALQDTIKQLRIWMSEVEVELLIKINLLKNWAQDFSFTPIVGFSEWAWNPHHSNRIDRFLSEKDLVLIDMWWVYEWYCSDISRVFFMSMSDEKIKKHYKLLQDIVFSIIEKWKVWMSFVTLDEMARKALWEYSNLFNHSLGHWIWINIHESPYIWPKSTKIIENGMVFTLEPWIYFAWNYGLRYEEMIYVKDWKLNLIECNIDI